MKMSDGKNDVMIDDFYAEPMDIVKYINTDTADEFMTFVVDMAIDFYMENEYSPIVEQQKFDGFVIDYYFLADCLSRFIEERVMRSVNDEKFVKNVRRKIKSDFAEDGDLFLKNAKYFLSVLDFLDVIVFSKKGMGIFSKTLYSTQDTYGEKIVFVLSGIFMHNSRIKSFERNLKKIGTKNNYKMEAYGRAIAGLLLKFGRQKQKVLQF